MNTIVFLTTMIITLTLTSCGKEKSQVAKVTAPITVGDSYLLKQDVNCKGLQNAIKKPNFKLSDFTKNESRTSPNQHIIAYAKEIYELTAKDVSTEDKKEAHVTLDLVELKSDKAVNNVMPKYYRAIVGSITQDTYNFLIKADIESLKFQAFKTSFSNDKCIDTVLPKEKKLTKEQQEIILKKLESSEKALQSSIDEVEEKIEIETDDKVKKELEASLKKKKQELSTLKKKIASTKEEIKKWEADKETESPTDLSKDELETFLIGLQTQEENLSESILELEEKIKLEEDEKERETLQKSLDQKELKRKDLQNQITSTEEKIALNK